jgi:myo-inositol 2-dehydrogenase/D-chiro-inositol 1-dehydrogenase
MRVGLVGAGRIGALHAETLHDLPTVSELVVADAEPARAREVADKVGADHAEVDELFADRVDALVIAAATSAHAQLVHRAADARLPVFCEKPLAADVVGTRSVLDHVEAAGVSLQVGFQRRFDAGYRAARQAVQSGRLGWVHSISATTFDQVPPHAGYIPQSGGIFRDCHIHDFDIIRFVTGREVVTVFSSGGNKGEDFFRDAGDVDTSAALLTLDDGTVATVLGGRYNGAGYDVRLEVHGSEAMVAVGLDERAPLRSCEQGVTWPPGQPYRDFFERFRAAYATELGDFVAHVLGAIPNPCPPQDALEALYVAEAAQRSLDERRLVHLEEVR